MDAETTPDRKDMTAVPQDVVAAAGDPSGEGAYLIARVASWLADVALHAPSSIEAGVDA
jgi:hypothetical protein